MRADERAEKDLHELLDPLVASDLLPAERCKDICEKITNRFRDLEKTLRDKGEEEFWIAFQKLFGFSEEGTDHPTPMNAANLCPEPTDLIELANELRLRYNNNVAQQTRMCKKGDFEDGIRVRQLQKVRELLTEGIGLDASDSEICCSVAMVRNSSEANNAIVMGIVDWAPEDEVVIWAENHPTNHTAWRLAAEWTGEWPTDADIQSNERFKVREVKFDTTRLVDPSAIANEFKKLINENTRVVSYSQISNGSGFMIPDEAMKEIYEDALKKNPSCHVHVDATMIWGSKLIDLNRKQYCHSLCSSAHKWFLGPKETALFWMNNANVSKFRPSIYAYDYKIHVEKDWRLMPNTALRLEMIGQRDDVNLITLGCTQIMWKWLCSLDPKEGEEPFPYRRVKFLAEELVAQLIAAGWNLKVPTSSRNSDKVRWGVIRIVVPRSENADDPVLYDWMYDRNNGSGKRIYGSGGRDMEKLEEDFRLCPHIYNTKADIDAAVRMMGSWRNSFVPKS